MSRSTTQADTRTRVRPHHLLPDRHALVDIAFTVALGCLALSGLASSFTGWDFLVVGALGVVLGVLITHVTRALGWPLISAVVVAVVVFFLLGGVLCLRSLGDSAVIPTGDTLGGLVDQAVFGWKDLLTTLPPVDGEGPLLVLPWLGGLVAGTLGLALARTSTRRPWLGAFLPVLGLTLVLAGVILLGVRHPQSLLLQGAAFAALSLGWLALRARRASATVHGGTSGWGRLLMGASMVTVAAAAALPASALVTGNDDRVVVRNWVEPPFDIGRYPSPLAGFRKYVDPQGGTDPSNVHDKALLTIEGVEPGTRVRFAALDHYDGMVWGATDDALPEEGDDSFQRVSSSIDNPVEGEEVRARVTIEEGWSGAWLPTVGALRSLEFVTGDPLGKAETFRYNLATSTGVVPSGLNPGDTYEFTAVRPDDSLDASTVPAAEVPTLPPEASFIQGRIDDWTKGAETPMARVLAAADHLRTEGTYSDGIGRAERAFVAGHNVWRLSDEFVNAEQMVGNDEQYAAVMALAANAIGVPARVVLGAEVPEGGVVTGEQVHAWVEVRAADGSWRTLDTEEFMDRRPPTEQQPETNTPMSGTVIPPPNPIPPPSDTGELSDAELKERKARKKEKAAQEDEQAPGVIEGLPGWVRVVAVYGGSPLLALLTLLLAVVGLKALRRRRRLGAASTSARFVGAWRELVDHARDLGQPVPLGPTVTRREQSNGIASREAPALARRADSFVFGPSVPDEAAAASYWKMVDAERRAMSGAVGRRRRLLAAISPRSLRRAPR